MENRVITLFIYVQMKDMDAPCFQVTPAGQCLEERPFFPEILKQTTEGDNTVLTSDSKSLPGNYLFHDKYLLVCLFVLFIPSTRHTLKRKIRFYFALS